MSLGSRIKRLESMLEGNKVSWRLKDGTLVEVYSDELVNCIPLSISGEDHPLLEKIYNADLSTYSGEDTLLGLIQAWLKSVEDYQK